MSFSPWLLNHPGLSRCLAARRKTPTRPTFRPGLEALEDRWLPSTLTVQNSLDSGTGSLRAEIAAAHNGDTINFSSSLNGQTIALSSGELHIKKNLTITGPGAGQLTISGSIASRVFEVAKNETVTLSGLTITKGSAVAAGAAGHGGAIDNYGTLTVSGSTLSNNTAFVGGGIYNELTGTLTVSNNSILTGNFASNAGGGINSDGTVTISNSTLSNNSTGFDGTGGGIINGRTMTVNNSTLTGNSAGNAGYGGGIDNGGTLTVSSCIVSGNVAAGGAGIENDGTMTVSGSTVTNNTSTYYGGGILDYGTLTVSGSTVTGNSAAQAGGGIMLGGSRATVTLKNSSTISGNTAPVGFGADIYNQGVLYLDSTSMIGILNGNPAIRI